MTEKILCTCLKCDWKGDHDKLVWNKDKTELHCPNCQSTSDQIVELRED